jgi:hypothetical protein
MLIPEMFKRLLKLWDHGAAEVPYFAYYLKRHIELDGDSHGPCAREMLMTLAGRDEALGSRQRVLQSGPSPAASNSAIAFWRT